MSQHSEGQNWTIYFWLHFSRHEIKSEFPTMEMSEENINSRIVTIFFQNAKLSARTGSKSR